MLVAGADRHSFGMVLDEASAGDATLPTLPAGIDLEVAPVRAAPTRAADAGGYRRPSDVLSMSRAARRLRCDVLFFPASYSYFPVLGPPLVLTVHDAIAERLPDLVFSSRSARMRWRLKQALAVRQAAGVITVSEASRLAVAASLNVPPDRLHVIREAAAPQFRPLPEKDRQARLARFGLDAGAPYLLYVGGISPHKNLHVLIEAFSLLAPSHGELRLVLVGDTDDDPFLSATTSLRAAAAASPAAGRISFTGFVTDDDLVALYGGAVACALPSLAEGFGLTAAEAAACGTAVVASPDPALMELLGAAALYADPHLPGAWAARFAELLDQPGRRAEQAAAGAAVAAGWSWAAAARTTLHVLEEVATRRG